MFGIAFALGMSYNIIYSNRRNLMELDSKQAFAIVMGLTMEGWGQRGMCPIVLYRLLRRGWSHEQVHSALSEAIGADYAEVSCTEWIDRLEKVGVEFPDEEPFINILDKLIFLYWQLVGDKSGNLTFGSEKGYN